MPTAPNRRTSSRELLGGNLIFERLRAGISKAGLADATGLSRQTISEIERGTTNPNLDVIDRIVDALGITIDRLFIPHRSGLVDDDELARRRASGRADTVDAREVLDAIKDASSRPRVHSTGILFDQYIGIDYSGAQTPLASNKGLRVYEADRFALPTEVSPPPSPRWYWSRREIAEWLVETLSGERKTIVGIDHGFSFPLRYFEKYRLAHDWPAFLDDFQWYWPTDGDYIYTESVRDGTKGNGAARVGNARWRRLTETRAGSAKSVFHFDVPGQVATSTHAGLPWLRYLRQALGDRVQFWPFDGWEIDPTRSVIAEVYPVLFSRRFAKDDRTSDQHDAYSVAAWLQGADRDGSLASLFSPSLSPAERKVAQIEGWILGGAVALAPRWLWRPLDKLGMTAGYFRYGVAAVTDSAVS